MGFIVGIRAETGNYQGLSSICEHFPKIKPHKQGRIENYQEFWHEYVGVTFGIRCKLDIPDCPTKKHIFHSNIAALYTKTPRKSSNIMVEFCPSTWEKPFCIAQYPLDCLKECICFSTEIYFWFYPPTQADYWLKPHSTLFRSFCIGAL